MARRILLLFTTLTLSATGCGLEGTRGRGEPADALVGQPDAIPGPLDAATGGPDAGAPDRDVSPGAADTGTAQRDSGGADAGSDVAADSGSEAEQDAGASPDAGWESDTSRDAGSDSGSEAEQDAGASPDAGWESDVDAGDTGADEVGAPDSGSWGPCSVQGTPGECLDVLDCDGVSTPGYCPGPANIQCCTPDVHPPSCQQDVRPLPNEGLVEAPGVGGCPAGMIPVADFCIDQYEASLVQIGDDGSLASWSPYFNPGDARVMAVSVAGAVPQGYISGVQAAAACAEAGKRLCTDAEWLRACQGPAGLTFPYGDTRQPGVCNDHRHQHPAVEYFGTSAPWIWSELGHPCINQLPASLDPTGARAECVTHEGAYDMMGNLHEWTSDPQGTFRGGYYVDTVINGPGCLYRTTAHNSSHWDYSTGFRCCSD